MLTVTYKTVEQATRTVKDLRRSAVFAPEAGLHRPQIPGPITSYNMLIKLRLSRPAIAAPSVEYCCGMSVGLVCITDMMDTATNPPPTEYTRWRVYA